MFKRKKAEEPNQDYKELARHIRRLEVRTHKLVNNIFGGEYRSVFKGRGIDFDEVREYQEGDDVRLIDWNVTARMDRLFVKKFVEERELTIMLAVDVSASLGFGTVGRLKRELAAEFAAAIALSAMQNHDRIGLFLFSDHAEHFVPPRRGRGHVLRLIRDLLVFQPKGTATEYGPCIATMQKVLPGRGILFVISDFIGLDFEQPLKGLIAKHDVIAVTLSDPREWELPDVGYLEVLDPETGDSLVVDTGDPLVRKRYAERAQELAQKRSGIFRALGVDELCLRTDTPYVVPLARFFQRRAQRQVRRRRG